VHSCTSNTSSIFQPNTHDVLNTYLCISEFGWNTVRVILTHAFCPLQRDCPIAACCDIQTFAVRLSLWLHKESVHPSVLCQYISWHGVRCSNLSTLTPSCADCLNIWEPQPPGTLKACNGIALPLHTTFQPVVIIDQHYALIIIPLFITQAPTCFGPYVPSSGSVLYPCELLESPTSYYIPWSTAVYRYVKNSLTFFLCFGYFTEARDGAAKVRLGYVLDYCLPQQLWFQFLYALIPSIVEPTRCTFEFSLLWIDRLYLFRALLARL
jgi:hypothetical protein